MEEDRGNRYGRRPGGVIRAPPKPGIPDFGQAPDPQGLTPGPSSNDRSQQDGDSTGAGLLTHGRA